MERRKWKFDMPSYLIGMFTTVLMGAAIDRVMGVVLCAN
jgi:hypothetical protein